MTGLSRGMSTPAMRAIQIHSLSRAHTIRPYCQLTLALLVLRDLADHPQHAVSTDDLALFAARLDRCPDLHDAYSRVTKRRTSTCTVPRPKGRAVASHLQGAQKPTLAH